jgi:Protein of unknown function (DUF2637)
MAYEPGHGVAGGYPGTYETGGSGLLSYGPEEPDTLPQGLAAPEGLTLGGQFRLAEPGLEPVDEDGYATSWEFEEGLARLLQSTAQEPAPVTIPRQRYAHRRQPRRLGYAVGKLKGLVGGPVPWLKVISLLMAALTAVIVAVVGALSGVISYDPLRRLAVPGQQGTLAEWWPLLVYGPWLVASLSILRAAVHRRRAAHSWLVVVVFSAIAVYMCVAHVGHGAVRLAVAGLPPITALVSFHQLVRQITLTNPPRNGPRRPRHTVRR